MAYRTAQTATAMRNHGRTIAIKMKEPTTVAAIVRKELSEAGGETNSHEPRTQDQINRDVRVIVLSNVSTSFENRFMMRPRGYKGAEVLFEGATSGEIH